MSPEANQTTQQVVPAHLHDALRECGFARQGQSFSKDTLGFAADSRWLVLSEEVGARGQQDSSGDLGQPGLWKTTRGGTPPRRVFELPGWAVAGPGEENGLDAESGPASFPSLLDWALETRQGHLPANWQPPAADLVRAWIPPGGLTLLTRDHLCQVESLLGADRWALRASIVRQLSDALPEPRSRALAELAAEAQQHWAMVRVGVTDNTNPAALLAEVDFTGAPHCELLFSAGLNVLRHVVAWLAETASVLSDPSIEIASLAAGGDPKHQTK